MEPTEKGAGQMARDLANILEQARQAISYVLDRAQEDPDFQYVLFDTEGHALLVAAEGVLIGQEGAKYRGDRRRNRATGQPRIVQMQRRLDAAHDLAVLARRALPHLSDARFPALPSVAADLHVELRQALQAYDDAEG